MTKTSNPIVFFGSGPVAAESLRLLAQDFAVEAVVTKPRPLHHKGDVPVLECARQLGLPVITAANKKELDTLFAAAAFHSRIGILVDFGIIVSQAVIDYFPLGIVNSHFSLLPKLRGADPITFAILSGQDKTGVSLMLLVQAMDEGPLLGFGEYPLPPTITTPELTADLILLSYELLRAVVPLYMEGRAVPRPQDLSTLPTYSRKLTKADGLIDWAKPATRIEREIRAFIEWPRSRTTINGIDIIITKARVVNADGPAGTTAIKDGLPMVYCGRRALVLDALQPAGKKEMPGKAFIAGYKRQFLQKPDA